MAKKKVSRVGGSKVTPRPRATASESEPVRRKKVPLTPRNSVLACFGGCGDDKLRVHARRVGQLAIHRAIDWQGKLTRDWVVTHAKTGVFVTWPTRDEAAARSLARSLTAARINLNFRHRVDMSARTRREGRAIVLRWMKRHDLTLNRDRYGRQGTEAIR